MWFKSTYVVDIVGARRRSLVMASLQALELNTHKIQLTGEHDEIPTLPARNADADATSLLRAASGYGPYLSLTQ